MAARQIFITRYITLVHKIHDFYIFKVRTLLGALGWGPMGFFHRQARGRWRQASSVLFTHTPSNS